MIKIITKRLVLKPFNKKDITQEYINNLNNPEINKFISAGKNRQTRKLVEDHIKTYPGVFLGIFLKNKHIGNLTIHCNSNNTVGVMIFKQYQGRGFALESLEVARYLGYNKAGINQHNISSMKLFSKAGFYIKTIY